MTSLTGISSMATRGVLADLSRDYAGATGQDVHVLAIGGVDVDVVGLLPATIRRTTVFTAAVCATSAQPRATHAFLAFLAGEAADAAKRRHGMEPVPAA